MEKENGNRNNNPITFGELAFALAGDYESIYVIDAEDDSYVEYLALGDNKDLVIRDAGEKFFEAVIYNAHKQLYPDDQEYFIDAFKRERVFDILKTGKSFSLNYRLMVDGKPLHYYLKTIRGFGQKVIIGVKNVDEQRRSELEAKEQILTYSHIAGALASRYEVIYYINLETNEYTQYSSSDEYAKLGTTKKGADFFEDAERDVKKYIHPEDKELVLSELDKERMLKHLQDTGSLALTYRQVLGDGIRYVSMNVIHPKNDKNHVIMGVMDIDAQIRREQIMTAENEVFNEIALALASRYEVIYYVNIINDEYSEYSASDKYTRLEIGTKGRNFFEDTQNNMKRDIYPDDYPMMAKAMEKQFLLKNLEESGKIFLNYRLMLDDRPQYVTLLAVRPQEDSEHIIVAVANVDASKRKEIEFEKAIDDAMDMANRDALTGVKNLHAYSSMTSSMDKIIKEGKEEEAFAIVVFDINGLKEVNDKQGHSAGDEFIRSACSIICKNYKHSPVFRIGGDEFVVILKSGDYNKREELLINFKNKMIDNRNKGLVTLAYGMSDFVPDKDTRVQDVFKRADGFMYENKRLMKEMPIDEVIQTSYPETRRAKLDKLYNAFSLISSGTYVYICDMRYDMSRWSKNAVEVFDLPDEYMFNAGSVWEQRIHPDDTDVYRTEIENIFAGRADGHDMQYRARKRDGEYVICTCKGIVLYDEDSEAEYFVGNIRDQSSQTHIDSLTGLSNQYGFLENIKTSMLEHKRMEIILLGIGRFAEYNDVYGYRFGNKILQRFARLLFEYVGNTGSVYRLDGTKFAIISNILENQEIHDRYELLRHYCRTRFKVEEKNIILDLNAGHISVDSFDVDSQTIYACLSYVYSESKLHKQGDMVDFLNELSSKNTERIERLHFIRGSIMKNYEGFYLLYQPVVDSQTEQLIGAEALIRWKNEKYGTVRPDYFIPLLEKDPLFPQLGEWILETALKDAKRIMNILPDFTVNVNLSYTQLEKGGFVDMVLNKLKEQDFPPDHLCLEITERCRLLDMDILRNVVDHLRSYGVKIALDDFGTGFSSIGLVKSLPLDTIKIDRSFILKIEEDDKEKKLVESFVNVASTFGAKVCVEGIETSGMKEILQKYHVQSFQGYYYAKPLSIDDLEKMVSK